MNVYELLAKAGARVTYFCAYCGYEFEDPPKLPAKCPRCGRVLANFSKPVLELRRMSVRRWEKDGVRDLPGAQIRRRTAQDTLRTSSTWRLRTR